MNSTLQAGMEGISLSDGNNLKSKREKVKTFWEEASKHDKRSTKCYLDGRYFNEVLSVYEGTVLNTLNIRIEEGALTEDPNDGDLREFTVDLEFDTSQLKTIYDRDRKEIPIVLIKMIIEISNNTMGGNSKSISRHSNLIWINRKERKIIRFEPIANHPYLGPIQTVLIENFATILPGYKFQLDKQHPQIAESSICPTRGMCSAFVLMQAMKIITGKQHVSFPKNHIKAEKQSLRFAYSIEKIFGTLPGEPEMDFGWFDGWATSKANPKNWQNSTQKAAIGGIGGAALGGLLFGSWSGALIGGALGAGGGYLLGKSQDKKKQYYK